jgi:chemotaxis protein CheD
VQVSNSINVNMSEIRISKDPLKALVALGLGSCIGICMYDPIAKTAGMAHVVLPEKPENLSVPDKPGKYAETAIPALLKMMVIAGAQKGSIITKIAGGGKMFDVGKASNFINIGQRNAENVMIALKEAGLRVLAQDIGGSRGRTVRLFVCDGKVTVKTLGEGVRDL